MIFDPLPPLSQTVKSWTPPKSIKSWTPPLKVCHTFEQKVNKQISRMQTALINYPASRPEMVRHWPLIIVTVGKRLVNDVGSVTIWNEVQRYWPWPWANVTLPYKCQPYANLCQHWTNAIPTKLTSPRGPATLGSGMPQTIPSTGTISVP